MSSGYFYTPGMMASPNTGMDPLGDLIEAQDIKDVLPTQGDRGSNGQQGQKTMAELRRLFEEAVEHRNRWTIDANEDYQFYYGDQWPDSARTRLNDGGRPSLTLNYCKSIINTVVGYQTQNRYEPDFLPRTEGDLPLAEVRRGVTKYVFDQNNYASVEANVFKDACIGGIGWFNCQWVYDEFYPDGHIVIARESPFNVYTDPEARELDFSDGEFIIQATWQSKGKVARMFPEWAREIMGIDELYDISETMPGHNGGVNANEPLWYSAKRGKVRLCTCWYRTYRTVNYGVDDNMEPIWLPDDAPASEIIKTEAFSEIRCATFLQTILLEDIVSPYRNGRFPLIPVVAYYTGEGDTPAGIIRDLKDPQLEINKRRSQILHIINTTAFNGWLAEEGAMSEKQKENFQLYGSKPGIILEVQQGAMQRMQELTPKPLPESIARLETAFAGDMKSISGINEEMLGTNVPSSSSGRAIELRQRMAITQIALLFDNLRTSKLSLVYNLWGRGSMKGLIPQFFTEEMLIRITEDTEEPTFAPVNQEVPIGLNSSGGVVYRTRNDLSAGEFDIVVIESPTTPSKRYADFLALMEMMKTPFGQVLAQTAPDVFLELSDMPNKARIAERIRVAQERMMAAQGQLGVPGTGQGSQSNAPSPVDAGGVAQAFEASGM